MRLKISKSKNSTSYYATKTTYVNGKEKTITVEKLGTDKYLREELNIEDPLAWAKARIDYLNQQEKDNSLSVVVKYNPAKQIAKNIQRLYDGGYLFLQDIYYDLKLHKICDCISERYKFEYDLNEILSRLVYGRILYPSSKKTTYSKTSRFLEPNIFELHQIYRALETLSKESEYIQAQLYKNSLSVCERNTEILYYDCTNFFFEIDEEEGLKQYGMSKEHRPNPIVQMGLFLDGNGIPLTFCINPGNTNEQTTLKPLEKKILSDFELSKFIVVTDVGLASTANRRFNDMGQRSFITTQSVKKLKQHLKDWALDAKGWRLISSDKIYDISTIDEEGFKDKVFYKERWINENQLEQKLIVTYSIKYKKFQQRIRNRQIERANTLITSSPSKVTKKGQNDYKRFIAEDNTTPNGEVANKKVYYLDEDVIRQEKMYDGFYAVCTNPEGDVADIIKVNRQRWEIEESFAIMKSEFKSRPVYLSRDDRIKAHFLTCFISLMIYRILEQKLSVGYTCRNILDTLKEMKFARLDSQDYVPMYVRTDLTDRLHDISDFRTDYEVISEKRVKKEQPKTLKKSNSNKGSTFYHLN